MKSLTKPFFAWLLSLFLIAACKAGKNGQHPLDTIYSVSAMQADFHQLLAQIENKYLF